MRCVKLVINIQIFHLIQLLCNGTFPASGYFWINGELIYYGGIDTINNKFVDCVRCVEVPDVQYAVDAPDDGYNWTNPLIVLADTANAFSFNVDPSWIDLTDEAITN